MRSRRNKTSEKRSQPWDEIDSDVTDDVYYAYNIVATVMMTMPMSDIQHKVIFTRLVLCDFASSHKKAILEMHSN